MKILLRTIVLLIFPCILNAQEWEKIELPTSEYYRVVYDKGIGQDDFIGTDKPVPDAEPNYVTKLKQALLEAGAEPFYIDRLTVINPFFDVYFGVSLDGYALYSHDGGDTWYEPILPKQIITYHFKRKFVTSGNKVYFLDGYNRIPLVSDDRCKTWKKFSNDNFFDLREFDSATLFYFGQTDEASGNKDYIVYKDIYTNEKDSSIVPSHILDWSYENMTVRGDTITIYNRNTKVYQSNNRGKDWYQSLNILDIFRKFITETGFEGTDYTLGDSLVVASNKFVEKDGSYKSHYIVSRDFGATWYYTDTLAPTIIENYCYFPKGTYQKYTLKHDSIKNVYLTANKIGNLRENDDLWYYQIRNSNEYFTKKAHESKWKSNTTKYQEELTNYDTKYFLNKSGILTKNDYNYNFTLVHEVKSFDFIVESPWIDILNCYNTQKDSESILYVKGNKVVENLNISTNDKVLAGINTEKPDFIYHIDIEDHDNLKMISYDLNSGIRDTLGLNLDISKDQIIKSILKGRELYLIGKTNLYISNDMGSSFIFLPNLQKYKSNDILFDNVGFYQGNVFTSGTEGILKLNDQQQWETIFKEDSNAYAFAVEFNGNKIHAYTEQGLFVSKMSGKVSHDKQNRNAILEYFSDIDVESVKEDKIAQDLQKDFENKLLLTNFYESTYYTHAPNFTTDEGNQIIDKILSAKSIKATLNRDFYHHYFEENGMKDNLNTILSKEASINISINSSIDPESRELEVELSYLYTKETEGTNIASIYLLQDNIKAFEFDASLNPEEVAADGLYYHQNVFRMTLTDNMFGDTIPSNEKGIYGAKTYKVNLPKYIKDVQLKLVDLKIVAFISNENEILQATGSKVDLPKENIVDLELTDMTDTKNKYFFDHIKPKVKVSNNGYTDVTRFILTYKQSSNINPQPFQKKISGKSSAIFDLDSVKADFIGNYSFSITGFENINNTHFSGTYVADITPKNNDCKVEGIRLRRDAFEYTKFTFESGSIRDYGFDRRENAYVNLYTDIGIGAENTDNSVGFSLSKDYDVEGKSAAVVFGEADLSAKTSSFLSFYYAYDEGFTNGTPPLYDIEYSENEGISWRKIHTLIPEATFTTDNNSFYPIYTQYKKEYVSLEKCNGKKVLIRIRVTPGTDGKSCWIDQVEISSNAPAIATDTKKIDFGKVTIADDVYGEEILNVENMGKSDLKLDSIKIDGSGYSAFEVITQVAGKIILPGESIELKIRFSPTEKIQYLANLAIYSNDPAQTIYNIRLEGEGEGTSVDEYITSKAEIGVFPNPSSDYIHLDFDKEIESAEVIDIYGKSYTVESKMKQIDISNLDSGSYFLKIISNGKAYLKQFVVVR